MVPDVLSRASTETEQELWTQHGIAHSLQHHRKRTALPPPHCSSPSQEPKGNCPWLCQSDDAVKRFGPRL